MSRFDTLLLRAILQAWIRPSPEIDYECPAPPRPASEDMGRSVLVGLCMGVSRAQTPGT